MNIYDYWPRGNEDIYFIQVHHNLSRVLIREDGYMMCDGLYRSRRIDSVYDWYFKLTIL